MSTTPKDNPDTHYRRSIRLAGYDYTTPGAYFVTIPTASREPFLCQISEEQVILSQFGRIVQEYLQRLPVHFSLLHIDQYVIMPDHLHVIIWVEDGQDKGSTTPPRPTQSMAKVSTMLKMSRNHVPRLQSHSLGAIINNFKSTTTRRINRIRGTPGRQVWQRNYFERVIRNERELHAIREYIQNNPFNWDYDDKSGEPSSA